MSTPQSLLPPNATPWEFAVSLTSAAQRPLDSDLIRRARVPWECPADVLPFLAHTLGVRLWYDDWSEYRKRLMCAQAMRLRAQEGTLAGIKGLLGFVDATVLRTIRPPAKTFLTGGLTDAQREAYLAGLPQIRIYPYQDYGTPSAHRPFLGAGRAFLGAMFVTASRGAALYGRKATIQLPNGTETAATLADVNEPGAALADRIAITGLSTRRAFLGSKRAYLGAMFVQASRAESLTATVRVSDSALTAFATLSGSVVQDVRPVRVYQTRTAPAGRFYLGRDYLGARKPHLRVTAGARLIYDRIALIDPTAVATPLHKGRAYLGHCRFGIRPYTAELLLDIPLIRPRFRTGVGRRAFVGSGFLRPASLDGLMRARTALGQAKALDDTILMDTEVYRRVRLGDGRALGSFKLGQIIRRI